MTNEQSISFYTKLGFIVSSTIPGYYDYMGGLDALVLVKRLDK